MVENLRNDKEVPKHLIIFYGLMKSGNHAVIKWVFENALRQYIPENEIQSRKLGYIEHGKIGNVIAFYNDVTRFPPQLDFITPCLTTIVSIEEKYDEIPSHMLNGVKWESVHKVFVFRDLKNLIASRKFCREYSVQRFGTTSQICEQYLKMFNDFNSIPNAIFVSYDELVTTGDSDLIEKLGIKPLAHRLRFNHIPRIISNTHKPGWSSFPGTTDFTKRKDKLSKEDIEYIDTFIKQNNLLVTVKN